MSVAYMLNNNGQRTTDKGLPLWHYCMELSWEKEFFFNLVFCSNYELVKCLLLNVVTYAFYIKDLQVMACRKLL